MKTFLTPDPVTLEIRNATGDIQIILTDTSTTTVDVTAGTSHPLGFLDDVFKAFGGPGRRFEGFARGRGYHGGPFGDAGNDSGDPLTADTRENLTDLVRIEHREGDDPTVIVDTDPARDGWRSSFSVTVTAPTGSNIRVQAQSSDLTVTGTAALVDVRTSSGDVRLDETGTRTLVQSASGDIDIAAAAGNVDIRTASGDVQTGPIEGDALVHTTSGDVRLGAVTGNISARSVSGDVRVSDATAGQAEVNAVSGDVEIGVHPGSLASINLSTVSGTTDTDFEVQNEVSDGDAPILTITVTTTSGDIRLRRAA
ncbi:DUF4097 and DUF4098 domain-containing protein YvlB [Nakamurella panacisegetis]|uniref:DUF4097 and DUF4098 domain-containing protein YvlB n=1 Tax=Nakamurella panacisegetis TaxID=1090615 RepID=A0A1H0SIM3_9ACTN|nr:DUF4097 family beta strand repeat-containing protein [Nakamurella panacisegetis]SDP41560.1 DUF4097 and DUF4098 domain-containing protein YvlB [Nakamurella panacisegetis]